VIAAAAPLVPSGQRDDWRAEWTAELAALSGRDRPSSLLRRALGAPVDAFWLRQRSIADLSWVDDLRHGWRQLRHQAGFAVTAIGVLAMGMAASVTAFSVVSQILLRPLPYPDPDRLVTVWERTGASTARDDVAPGNFLDWRARAKSFRYLAAGDPYSYDYTGGERPEVLRAVNVTEGFFEAFGIQPQLGRFFLPEEHKKGANRFVVLSARMWRSRFGADPGVVGRAIPLDQTAYTIVGVAPDDFQPNLLEDLPGQTSLWAAKAIEDYEPRSRGGGYWQVIGRLADGVSLEAARAEMDTIAAQIETENPRTNKGRRTSLVTIREHLVGDIRPAVTLFTWAVIAVLLIACVNVTNLLLARGAVRQQELAVRTAMGASRARLVGQLLMESLLLSSMAALAAVILARGAIAALSRLGPRELMWIDSLHVDGQALAFAAVLTFVVAIAAGLVPALRLSGRGLQAPGHRTMTGDRSQRRLRSALVAIEVATALVLVSGSALLLRSFVNLVNVDTGFRSDGVMVLQVFAWDRNPDPAARRTFFERVLARLDALPAVDQVGAVSAMPFIESNIDIQGNFRIVGQPAPAPGEDLRSSFNVATPGYFTVMRIPLVRGRHLDERDGPEAPKVAVIGEALARRYFAGLDPIGQRIALRYAGQPLEVEVVGVVGATRHDRLDAPPRPEMFLPHAQASTGSMTLVARTGVDPRSLIEAGKAEVWAVDPLQTFYRTASLDELVGRTLTARRFALVVLTGFAALALLLAAAGLYGVLSTIVSQYRREIGVRMALGARAADIVRLIVSRGLTVAALGVAIGLAGALGGSRLLSRFLFSVAPTDPMAIGGAAVLMLSVAALACYVPARRAAGADPVEALRVE
jgi:putative ABC transport system permease protein